LLGNISGKQINCYTEPEFVTLKEPRNRFKKIYFARLGLIKHLQIQALLGSLFLGIDSSGGIDFPAAGSEWRRQNHSTNTTMKTGFGVGFLLKFLSAHVYTKKYCQWQNYVLFR
jgi:hypothetical protein